VLVSIFITLASRIYKGGQGPLSKHDLQIILRQRNTNHHTGRRVLRTYGPNLSKSYVPCTFEFLISVSPHPKLTTLGISLGGQPIKHRQLARQVGERVKDPPASSMASFQFTSWNQLQLVELHQQTIAEHQEAQLVTQQQR
jgi:hypothetical protein